MTVLSKKRIVVICENNTYENDTYENEKYVIKIQLLCSNIQEVPTNIQ